MSHTNFPTLVIALFLAAAISQGCSDTTEGDFDGGDPFADESNTATVDTGSETTSQTADEPGTSTDADLEPVPPNTVETGASGVILDFDFAISSSGEIGIVWSILKGVVPSFSLARLDATGAVVDSPLSIEPEGGSTTSLARLDPLEAGGFAFTRVDSSPRTQNRRVLLNTLDSAMQPVGPTTTIAGEIGPIDPTNSSAVVKAVGTAVGEDGTVFVVWIESDGTLAARSYTIDGTPLAGPTVLSKGVNSQSRLELSASGDRLAMTLYETADKASSGSAIACDFQLAPILPVTAVSGFSAPHLSLNSNGMLAVGSGAEGVYKPLPLFQLFDEQGVLIVSTEPELLDFPTESYYASRADVVMREDGGFIGLWYGPRAEGSNEWNASLARFDNTGKQLTTPLIFIDSVTPKNERPALRIARRPNGQFAALWNRGVAGRFFLQRFDTDGTPLGTSLWPSN